MFDAESFLNSSIDQTNDTIIIPVPVGEFLGACEKVEIRNWAKRDEPSVGGLALDLVWTVEDEGVKATLGRDKVTVKQGIILDLTESGGLDMGKGKNIGLGRLREAVGLNVAGQPFSFNMLPGRLARLSIGHRPDKNDSSIVYAEVKAVAKA
jgi:hypothetical protein